MIELTIIRPDDWHLHLRDAEMLRAILLQSWWARRAIVMPNLVPPVVTKNDVIAYRARIDAATPPDSDFTPLMTLYLTDSTDPDDVERAAKRGFIIAVKLYPAGATTNSSSGVTDIEKVMPVLERMAEIGLPLCVHGEVTDPGIDIFDREAVFIDRVLDPIKRRLPELKTVMEHITTKDAVDYVKESRNIGATITVQHLMLNRNDLLVGGIKPHYYCLPILKANEHQIALVAAAISGDPKFFLGTDSAPHPTDAKESACGCAGCFTAPIALPGLATVFEKAGALDRLEGFTSRHGPEFYGLPVNTGTLTLVRHDEPVDLPKTVAVADGSTVTVFDPGRPIHWEVTNIT